MLRLPVTFLELTSQIFNMRIAIQKNGRMTEQSLSWLKQQGLQIPEGKGMLLCDCKNAAVQLLFVRNEDIPTYVLRGVVDFGIVGENVLIEQESNLKKIQTLNFADCRLVLAVPKDSSLKAVEDLEGLRIATSYPNTLRNYLREKKLNAAIIPIRGSVEVTPKLNLAEAVCDLTQSGKTLAENNLIPLATILESKAALVSSKWNTFNLPL